MQRHMGLVFFSQENESRLGIIPVFQQRPSIDLHLPILKKKITIISYIEIDEWATLHRSKAVRWLATYHYFINVWWKEFFLKFFHMSSRSNRRPTITLVKRIQLSKDDWQSQKSCVPSVNPSYKMLRCNPISFQDYGNCQKHLTRNAHFLCNRVLRCNFLHT